MFHPLSHTDVRNAIKSVWTAPNSSLNRQFEFSFIPFWANLALIWKMPFSCKNVNAFSVDIFIIPTIEISVCDHHDFQISIQQMIFMKFGINGFSYYIFKVDNVSLHVLSSLAWNIFCRISDDIDKMHRGDWNIDHSTKVNIRTFLLYVLFRKILRWSFLMINDFPLRF